jgi:ABC-2 type transport system permease protein
VFALPLFSLALSCILGFLIALISSKIKNKSLFTVIFSFGFMAVYFYLVMEMENYLAVLISSGEIIAENIKTFVYPVYSLGKACTGDALSLLIFLACVTAFFALIMFIVCSSFIKLSTAKHGGKKAVYKEKTYRENAKE